MKYFHNLSFDPSFPVLFRAEEVGPLGGKGFWRLHGKRPVFASVWPAVESLPKIPGDGSLVALELLPVVSNVHDKTTKQSPALPSARSFELPEN